MQNETTHPNTKAATRAFTADEIIKVVCDVLGYPYHVINTKSRKHEFVQARYACYHFLRRYTKLGLQDIGDLFCGRHHASVLNGLHDYRDNFERRDKSSMQVVKLHTIIDKQLNNYFNITPEQAAEEAIREILPNYTVQDLEKAVPNISLMEVINRACTIYSRGTICV